MSAINSKNPCDFLLRDLDDPEFDFSKVAEPILKENYLKPFPKKISKQVPFNPEEFTIQDDRINRVVHGAMHASRVAAYIKPLHLLRLHYQDPEACHLNILAKDLGLTVTQIIHLTQISALFHDSAREGEGVDHWDRESSEKCLSFLKINVPSLDEKIAIIFSSAICYKDQKSEFIENLTRFNFTVKQIEQADYIRQLIADADCLDIMRIRKNFKMKFLNICHAEGMKSDEAFSAVLKLTIQIRNLIAYQKDLYFPCSIIPMESLVEKSKKNEADLRATANSFDIAKKCEYENSDNIYKKVRDDLILFL